MCCIDVVLLCSGVIAGSTALGNFCGASCSQVSIGLNRNHLAISKRNCYETILTGSNASAYKFICSGTCIPSWAKVRGVMVVDIVVGENVIVIAIIAITDLVMSISLS